jgi:hypothetical protein
MVKACEPYHSLSRARLAEHFGAGFAVVGCPRERPAKLEPRPFRARNTAQTKRAAGDPGSTVSPSLVTLTNVVDQGRGKEIGVALSARHKPARRCRSMYDVARVLGSEQCQQFGREQRFGEGIVALGREIRCLAKLAQPITNHAPVPAPEFGVEPVPLRAGIT